MRVGIRSSLVFAHRIRIQNLRFAPGTWRKVLGSSERIVPNEETLGLQIEMLGVEFPTSLIVFHDSSKRV